MEQSTPNFHFDYMEVTQHWHSQSQSYAGGDSLLTALDNGWGMGSTIFREERWFAGMRSVTIYHFEMFRNNEKQIMSVVNTPYITRLIKQTNMRVEPVGEGQIISFEQPSTHD